MNRVVWIVLALLWISLAVAAASAWIGLGAAVLLAGPAVHGLLQRPRKAVPAQLVANPVAQPTNLPEDEERERLVEEYARVLDDHQDAVDRLELANLSLYRLKRGLDPDDIHPSTVAVNGAAPRVLDPSPSSTDPGVIHGPGKVRIMGESPWQRLGRNNPGAWWVVMGNGLLKLGELVALAYSFLFTGLVYAAVLGLFLVGTFAVFGLLAMAWSAGTHG